MGLNTKIKFSLGFNFDPQLIEGIAELNEKAPPGRKVTEFFAALPDSPIISTRPDNRIPHITWNEFVTQLKKMRNYNLDLNYVLNAKGTAPTGVWVPFRELSGGKNRYRLFEQRCEKGLKQLADSYPALFEDLMVLFNAKEVKDHYQADISLVLYPLPLMPILICYWKPEEEMASELNLFFDETAEENLNIQAIYTLGAGLVTMFEKIALKHGIPSACPVH